MANVSAAATVWNVPNYVGPLFLVGANQTPFLNMAGGLTGGKQSSGFEFAVSQEYSLETAAQPAITETASLTASSFTTSYVRAQAVNSTQIFQKHISVSYAKQSVAGQVSGLAQIDDSNPVQSERDFQISASLKQLAVDVDFTFLQGAYQKATSAAVASKTRGIIAAVLAGNSVAAGGATLSKALIDQVLLAMAGNGSTFTNPVVFVNGFQKQKISSIYGYAPADRNIGGVNVKQIETDFAELGVIYAPHMPAATLLIADMAYVAPVFTPVPGKGFLFVEDLAKSGAADPAHLYGQIGLDHGPGAMHGSITGLATS